MATITDSPSSTFGLASQLRTPPPPSPILYGSEAGREPPVLDIVPISAKKVTPAMREELRRSPKITGTPAWISRSDSSTSVQKVHAASAVRSSLAASTKSDADGEVILGRHKQDSQAPRSSAKGLEDDNSKSSKTPLSPPELIHITKPKFSLNAQRTGPPPPRPVRPSSTPFLASALESSTSLGAIPGGEQNDAGPIDVSFPSLGSLDLGVQFDETAGAFYSTFRPAGGSQRSSAKTWPNKSQEIEIPAPVPTVGDTTSAISATVDRSDVSTSSVASRDTPIQDQSPKLEPTTPVVEKVKSSRPSPAQASGPFPNNTASPKSSTSSKMSSSFVAPNKSGRLPGNLLSLARRTAHISDTVGYAWRLALLEKLEAITGPFLTIEDAEAILSIGASPASKAANRANHRKSLIGMPTVRLPPQRKLHKSNNGSSSTSTTEVAAGSGARNTFFNKMKRALGAPVAESEKADASTKTQLSKGIFGVPLTVAAEYGFVTSMIAGQRHELPGVCFSAVEEIYRRGQGELNAAIIGPSLLSSTESFLHLSGMNVPGLLVNHGESSRVAKLVAIYNTAPEYGEQHDLSIESIHNVTALLKKYLRDLPEPVLDQRLWKLFLSACVYSTNSIKVRVTSAQVILRLLPTPNFSLLVYMVAFLSQIPLFPENRISLESVSHIVGAMLMSPRDPSPQSQSKGSKLLAHITGPTDTIDSSANAKRAEEALLWLLKHWSLVADGLLEPEFDVDVDAVLDRDPVAASTRSDSLSHPNDDTEEELDGAADPLRFLPNDDLKKSMSQPEATSSRATLLIALSAKAKVEQAEVAQVKPQPVEPEIQRGAETEAPRAPDTPTTLEILPRLHSGSVPGGPTVAETPDVSQYSQDTPVNVTPVERVVSTFADSDVTSRRVSAKTMTPIIFDWEPPTKGGPISHQEAHKPHPIQVVAEEVYEDLPPPTPAKEVTPDPYGAPTSSMGPPPSQDLPTTPMSDDTAPVSPTAAIHQVTSRELQEDFLIAGVNEEATPVPALDDERRGTSLSSSESSAQEGALTPFSSARSDSILASYSMDRSARNSESSRKSMNSANGFSRARAEDAYGPLGMDESVLDDLMDFDDDTSSAVLKFPSPPGSAKTRRLSELTPTVLASITKMQATRRTSRASVSSQTSSVRSGPRGLPRLVDADQLDEAKRTIDAQRVEITDLWKQLTDLETQREADRHHLSTLQMQILELRTAGQAKAASQIDEKQIQAEWEAKLAEQSKAAQEQLEASKVELEEARKELRVQDDESRKQIASLSSQLDAIRSLLMAGMAGGVSAST
ncbi:BZ3500_MvSof-1268-A1-R1_Chr1-2g01344 [Microbotryum saponariae]|uniref:BZ3500_MvSof-1268-A1-R1_Chr1-2g01344 protein n=1 Tax=Microbotryum saponariae TaxID=289078 RepID=A0A2X0KEB8_9BASI|nr:BZ3500_MvSof-1268-A1-R1_Chr1-2g01344 [Microbotryum saponariae]SCZ97158.1 BZ3501_MvSof-1269-A2-R1_Chr1-2g00943 [Microbotryum saponariae]